MSCNDQSLIAKQLLQDNGTILSENNTKHIEEIEEQATIISTVIQQRHALGISQRELNCSKIKEHPHKIHSVRMALFYFSNT